MGISSPSMNLAQLGSFADNLISPTLSTLNGVAQVEVYGQKRYAVRINVKADALAARGLTLDDLAATLKSANANTPLGTLNAEVLDSVEVIKSGSWVNGERAIVMAVQRQPDANTVAVVDDIYTALPHLQNQMPDSIRVQIMNDRSKSIRDTAATIIPTLSLPISIIGTIALMKWLGYSLDNISLLGITLAVGLVVDDAIVMLENIMRHIENGMAPLRAALIGSKEMGFTIVSISVSLVAVFIPIFFMPGVIGLMFHEFAVVVSLAILVSALVSLTLIPMLSSKFLSAQNVHNQNSFVWNGV
ncbi:hypothetical protein ACTFIZ_007533 [Dictyostelium cf. discoideum]